MLNSTENDRFVRSSSRQKLLAQIDFEKDQNYIDLFNSDVDINSENAINVSQDYIVNFYKIDYPSDFESEDIYFYEGDRPEEPYFMAPQLTFDTRSGHPKSC